MMTSTGHPQKTLFYCKSLLYQICYTKPVFQLDTTYTTNNYHYNADVTNLEIHNKKASTCTTRASIIIIYIFLG